MLKFFRRIRKHLIEKRRLSDYLLYGFGEILLVVLGILIALQINSWAVSRQNRQLEKEYLEALYFELQEDTSFYRGVSVSLEQQYQSVRRVVKIMQDPSLKIKDSLQFVNDLRDGSGGDNLERSVVSWEELQSTGQISLFQSKALVKSLFEYYNFAERFVRDFNRFPLEQRLIVRQIEHGLFSLEENEDFFDDFRQSQKPSKASFEAVRNHPKLLSHLKSVLISSGVQRQIAEETLEKAEDILALISTEMEQK